MKQKIPEMYKYRNKLLKISNDMGLQSSLLKQYTDPMRGKTEEEKEAIAADLIRLLENKEDWIREER